ncbi:MAG: hypothetical protein AUK35_02260 [Zetaproteobacteria bacterium CG2_30_46_52]|nr:MAG: hypothetical protein AUK35_02260 [Zetaproteobacteria bacterium CG2_30_46_52]
MLLPKMPEFSAPLYDLLSRAYRLLFKMKYPLQQNVSDYQPFFIIGSGRCGSTLLRRMLDAHPGVHIPPETYVLGEVIRLYMRNRQMDWKYIVNTVYAVFEFSPEFDKFEMHMAPLVHRMWHAPEAERSLAYLLDAFYRYHGEVHNIDVQLWGDKTPQNTFDLDVISKTFPKAKYLHLLRDGVDVAASFVERGLQPDLLVAARHWQRTVNMSQSFMEANPDACIEVRYEDLVRDPQSQMQSICHFLNIHFDEKMIRSLEHTQGMGDLHAYEHYKKVLGPVSDKNIGLGRRNLSSDDLEVIVKVIGPSLKKFGYLD